MPQLPGLSLLRSRFVRRLSLLSGGFVAGQLLIVASSPILTRLFTPAEFGVYAVFTAITGIFGNVLSFKYELAVPIARSDADAAALLGVSVLAVIGACLVTGPIAWLGRDWLATATEMPELPGILWSVPITIVLLSVTESVSYWSVYRGTYRLNAAARMVQSAGQSAIQVGLGLLGFTASGMVLGYALGYAARLLYLLRSFPPADRHLIAEPSRSALLGAGRRHWRYAAFSTPAALLEACTGLLPAIFIAMLFGPALAGMYGLGQRLMGLPVRLFAQAARQVFLGEAAERSPAGLFRLFRQSSMLFLALGLVGMTPILLAGPQLFALLFGEAWRSAGSLVQLLVPVYLTRFVVTPVSQTLNILGRQNLHLVSASLDATLMLSTFGAAWLFDLGPMTTVLLFSLGSTMAYLVYYGLAWRVVQMRARAVPAGGGASVRQPIG